MSIGETFSRLLLKRLVDDVFLTGGVEALDAVTDFLTRCGQQDDPRLTAALEQAMQRAWAALEGALGGEPSWDHSQPGLAPRDAQALRHCLNRVLTELAHGGAAARGSTALLVAGALRRQCLDDLHLARTKDALEGCIDREEWARSNEVFVRFAADQARRDTRRRTEGQLLRDLEQHGCVGLMRLLTAGSALPLLLMSARAFLCQELTHLLYRCLQENPEQTPDNCTLVLDILHELSSPQFTIWHSPAPSTMPAARAAPVHWSRLESRSPSLRRTKAAPPRASRRSRKPKPISPPRPRAAVPPRTSWTLAAVLAVAVAMLVVLPIWLLVDNARRYDDERQRAVAERQRIRDERRRIEAEHQRLIDVERQIAREDAARQLALQRQHEEEERWRRLEAEEEKQRAEALAIQRREAERRRCAEEREAQLREKKQRLEQAQVALEDGLTLAALGKDREALAVLSETLLLDPSLSRAWSARGVTRRRLGDLDGALTDFHEAVRLHPDDVRSRRHCGELHRARREYRQAIEAFTVVLRAEPDNAEVYRQRGLCHGGIDDVDEAIADQTKAIELAPNDPWAYFYRAELLRRRGSLDGAFVDYTSAIDRDRGEEPGLSGAYRGRGLLLVQRRQDKQAIRDLTQALELDPNDTVAQLARGQVYLRRGEWNKALLDAEEVLQHKPEDSAAHKLRGQAYLALRQYREADDDFSRALRKERAAETFYLRARAKAHLGEINEAIYDCNQATSLDPKLASAFYLRARLHLHEGYRASALADHRTAHELDPQYPLP
jgi:tetratricopeptide (TPR) repeat protein